MTIQETIKNRRTIKPLFFTGETIADQDIKEMLECANWAPTHRLTEPWRFIVFSEDAKNQFGKDHAEMYKEVKLDNFEQKKYDKLMTIADKSSHVIAIIMQRDAEERVKEIEEIAAVACAVQNMMLVATEKGIANIWSSGGLTYHSKMKDYLGFEEKDKVMGFLYLGISELKPKSKRFISIEDKTVWKK
ncbi:MAG: nitroreductase [Planctomycetota bacterium]|jgi:nitroreductase